jgi:hypothetical protein
MSTRTQSAISFAGFTIGVVALAVVIYLLVVSIKQKSDVLPGTGPTGPEGPAGPRGITGPTGPSGTPGNSPKPTQLIGFTYFVNIPASDGDRVIKSQPKGANYFNVGSDGTLECTTAGNYSIMAFARCSGGNSTTTYLALMTDSASPWDEFNIFEPPDFPDEILLQEIGHQLQPSYSWTSQIQATLNQVLPGNRMRIRYRINQNGAFYFDWIFVITPM